MVPSFEETSLGEHHERIGGGGGKKKRSKNCRPLNPNKICNPSLESGVERQRMRIKKDTHLCRPRRPGAGALKSDASPAVVRDEARIGSSRGKRVDATPRNRAAGRAINVTALEAQNPPESSMLNTNHYHNREFNNNYPHSTRENGIWDRETEIGGESGVKNSIWRQTRREEEELKKSKRDGGEKEEEILGRRGGKNAKSVSISLGLNTCWRRVVERWFGGDAPGGSGMGDDNDVAGTNTESCCNKNNNSHHHQPHPSTPMSSSSTHHHNHRHHYSSPSPYTSSSRSSTSCKWSRIMIVALFQMASVLSQALSTGPKFGESIPNVTVAVGRDASLPCVIENLGNHKVAWVHIDRRMILTIHKQIVTRIPRFGVYHDSQKTWLLQVNNVQPEDKGYYMCQVNTEPMISQVGFLQVVVPPNIIDDGTSESQVAVREQLNVTLSCKADGAPVPRIIWKREDGKPFHVDKRRSKVNYTEGEKLQLYKISRVEMGAYLCIASNGVPPSVSKRIIVDVEFQPMIWVPNQLVGAPLNTTVTLECTTEAFPRAISYWTYDSHMILTTGKFFIETVETGYTTWMKLTIRHLEEKDYGKYKCVSKNSLGDASGEINLSKIEGPSSTAVHPEVQPVSNGGEKNVVVLTPFPKPEGKQRGHKSEKPTKIPRINIIPTHSIQAPSTTTAGSSKVHFSLSTLTKAGLLFMTSTFSWRWNNLLVYSS